MLPSPTQASAASEPLSTLTIRLSDLRPGYVVSQQRYRTPRSILAQEPVTARLLLSHRWMDGYTALYERAENPKIQVGEFADRFKTVRGAHWWYGASLVRVPTSYHTIRMYRVGEESTAVASRTFVGIIFRRGRVVVDVYVSQKIPSAPTAVFSLARLIDRRLLLY